MRFIKHLWESKYHKQKKFLIFPLILAVVMVISSIGQPVVASEIDKAEERKTNLEKKKEETEKRISELEQEKDDILNYIKKLDEELSRITDEIDTLNGDITVANEELEVAKEELEQAKITEENQYSTMKKRIKYMYENGNSSYLDVVMQSESLPDVLNHVEYITKITEYDNHLLEEYKELKQDVIKKEEVLKTKIENLNGLKDELLYEQETVERLSDDKNAELVKYEASIAEAEDLSDEYSSQLVEQEELIEALLEAERKRIEEERRRREEEEKKNQQSGGNDSGSENTVSGDFLWPVPSSGRITSTFGYRNQPTAGASTYHRGIDIGAPSGTDIVASMSGTVVTAAYSVSAGNYIMISHGGGVYTVYMHCSKLLVSVGDEVSKGEVIGKVGSTGYSTGPHLHFGISIDGEYVNPQNYVSY
ncbi:MAG: peptidase [Lachnospiraceae bacterium]|jgi:murein DD-endopeptidase MepM/ murein hydrolase activator NlpD|nr:peptidase [Lachnospiraceae bacterium]